jgi:hypothetical protein
MNIIYLHLKQTVKSQTIYTHNTDLRKHMVNLNLYST